MNPLAISGRRFGFVAALLALVVLSPGPGGDARAEPEARPIVSPDVLELMGLTPASTLVLGVRLPMTPHRLFGGTDLHAIGELVATAFDQSLQGLQDQFDWQGFGDIQLPLPPDFALAITLEPGGSKDGWSFLPDAHLILDEVTLLLCYDWDRGPFFAVAGAVYIAGKRLAVAMTLHREPSLPMSALVQRLKDAVLARVKGTKDQVVKKAKGVLWPEPPKTTEPTTGGSQGAGRKSAASGSTGVGDREDGRATGPMGPAPKPTPEANSTTGAAESPKIEGDAPDTAPTPVYPSQVPRTPCAPGSHESPDGEVEYIDGRRTMSVRHRILTIAGRFDAKFTLGDFREVLRWMDLPRPLEGVVSDDALVFERLVLGFEIDISCKRLNAVSVLGTLEFGTGGVPFNGLLTFRRPPREAPAGEAWRCLIGIEYESVTLKQVFRGLEGHFSGDIWIPSMALVLASHEVKLPYWEMNPVERYFFEPIFSPGETDFLPIVDVAQFHKGMNFMGPARFGALLGIAKNVAKILWSQPQEGSGSTAKSDSIAETDATAKTDATSGTGSGGADEEDGPMLMLTGNPGIGLPGLSLPEMPSLKDLSLRVQLPPLHPSGAPAWFVRGDLYAELTGRPSFSLGGSMTVLVEGDVLEFFVEGEIARDGAGVSVSLAGGLAADAGWASPFGIDWLTIRKAVLKLSVNAFGNVGLGFAGDVTVGTKDIAVAAALAVNAYTGVPTNLVLYGESEQGVSLEDIVLLQQAIAQAAGHPGPPIRLDKLPQAAVRNLRLLFAPKDDPQLGVEAGLGLSGDLWIEPKPGEPLQLVGSIDLAVDRAGVRGHGFVEGYALGPVEWSDAEVNLSLTLGQQRLALSGTASIYGKSKSLEVELTREGLLDDFLEAHGAALGAGAAAAKEKLLDAKDAAQAKAQKVKDTAVVLHGKKKKVVPKPILPRR